MTPIDPTAPPPPARGRGPLVWILGCCGGCLLLLLVAGGGLGYGMYRFGSAWEESKSPETAKNAYDEVVHNVGPPPGFRIVQGIQIPFFGIPVVAFAPEQTPGSDIGEVMQSGAPFTMVFKTPETETDRGHRDQLFETGRGKGVPDILRPFVGDDRSASQALEDIQKGVLGGHRFPLRYVLGKTAQGRHARGGDSTPAYMAFVDLTAPEAKSEAAWLIVLFRDEPITVEWLDDFCRNFRPGE